MKNFLFLALSALLLWSCGTKELDPKPVITITNVSLVGINGGEATITYTIENPKPDAEILATTTNEWISDFDYSVPGTISFEVSKNESGAIRNGMVNLSYEGASDVVATVEQLIIAIIHNTADANDNTVNTLGQAIIDALGEGHETKNIIVTGTMNNADFASLIPFEHIDISAVNVVGKIANLLNQEQTNSIPTFAFHVIGDNGRPAGPNSTLKSIKLPNSMTEISAAAMGQCIALEEIRFPDELVKIQTQAFYQCIALKRVTNWGKVEVIESRAFSDCLALEALELPNTITTLEAASFAGCETLTSVVLPESMQNIIGNVFAACTSLKTFSAPAHLDFSAADYCFYRTGIEDFTFNSATTTIPAQFLMSTKLKKLDIPATITLIDNNIMEGKAGSFADIQTLTEITVHWTENIPAVDPFVLNPDTFNIPNSTYLGTFPESFGTVEKVGAELSKYSIKVPAGTIAAYLAVPGWDSYNLIEE